MESDCGWIEVCLDNSSSTKCDQSIPMPESPNDFLIQIEHLGSSGLAKFFIGTLELIERRLQSSKGKIDIITFECIITEFLQRSIGLFNRNTEKPRQYRLEMENKDDSNRIN